MKKLLIVLLILISPLSVFSQGKIDLTIIVNNPKKQKMPSAQVALVETTSGKKIETKTDATGTAVFQVMEGKEWQLYVNGSKMRNKVTVPDDMTMKQTIVVTYNPELDKRMEEQSADRNNFQNEEQKYSAKDIPAAGKAMVKIMLQTRTGIPQVGKKVRIVQVKEKKSYTATTGSGGLAFFMLDMGKNYDIDVEDNLNVNHVDIKNTPGLIIGVTCFFDPPKIEEQRFGDTIIQKIKKEEPATGRAFYTISVKHYGADEAIDEPVYLAEIHGTDIYLAYTDADGNAKFLVPIGKKYMVHFNFERDVDVVDLSNARGYVTGSLSLHYRPNPKLQHPELFIPDKEQLFLIDFENFLTKNFPKPKAPDKVGIFLKWGNKINDKSKEAVLEIGYTAEAPGGHIPSNMCFVVDNSGSMAGYYRIERLKEAMVALFKTLPDNDVVSLVTFESSMEVLMTPQKVGPNRQKFIDAINRIQPKGGTNMKEALQKGYEFVKAGYIKGGNNRVILLTDGYDENKPEELVAIQSPFNTTVECTAIGVGEDYNYALLKQLASNGRGLLLFVGESDQFMKVFSTELMQMLKPVAAEVTIEIEYNKRMVFKHLYGYTPVNAKTNPVTYAVANLYTGANRVALAKFDLVQPDKTIEQEPVIVRIRFTDAETGKKVVVEEKIYPEWEPYTGKTEALVEGELKKMYAIAEMNRALKLMSEFYTAGENEKARTVLEETYTTMKKIYPDAKDEDIKNLLASMEQYLEAFKNLARKNAIPSGKKKIKP